MKLSNDQLKKLAEHVRLYFSKNDREMVTPLFKMIKTLQLDNDKIQSALQESLFATGHRPQLPTMNHAVDWSYLDGSKDKITFKEYLKSLVSAGKEDEILRIAKVRKITVHKLLKELE